MVPLWLQNSKLYLQISDSKEEFEIPDEYFLDKPIVIDLNNWIRVKNISDYWNINKYPLSIVIFAIRNRDIVDLYLNSNEQMDITVFKQILKQEIHDLNVQWSFYWFKYILDHNTKKWNFRLLCDNPNVTWELMIANPQLFQKYISKSINPNITWEIIQNYSEIQWDYHSLSANPNINWNIIQLNNEKNWNYSLLSMNKNITFDIINNNPELPWNDYNISLNPNITWDIIQSNKSFHNWNYFNLGKHPNINWDIICNNPSIPWHYNQISLNPNITWNIVINNINKKWNYRSLMLNSTVTFDILQNNKDKLDPSDYYLTLSLNPNITWNIIDLNSTIHWNYEHLSMNLFTKAYNDYLTELLEELI